ncbi:hypothetical protein EDB81DRAFT_887058 [Dactylonectria macrodidyma]|uniref:Uncharacterized protein n=1 Tax=Dactylonectria macrodidyma TaxID=307937 RepID=A0A9P9IUS2_9HYPO|nr:hypothetical protein EDB81DRAFT_887058 [Dactylonectria macrodidyma]
MTSELAKVAQENSQNRANAEAGGDVTMSGTISPRRERKQARRQRPSLPLVTELSAKTDHTPQIKSPLGTRPVLQAEDIPTSSYTGGDAMSVDETTRAPLNSLSPPDSEVAKARQEKEYWESEAKRWKDKAGIYAKMAKNVPKLETENQELRTLKKHLLQSTAELNMQLKESDKAKVRAEEELAKLSSDRLVLQKDAQLALERASAEIQFIQEITKFAYKESQNVRQLLDVVKGVVPVPGTVLNANEERKKPRQMMAANIDILNAFEAGQRTNETDRH